MWGTFDACISGLVLKDAKSLSSKEVPAYCMLLWSVTGFWLFWMFLISARNFNRDTGVYAAFTGRNIKYNSLTINLSRLSLDVNADSGVLAFSWLANLMVNLVRDW